MRLTMFCPSVCTLVIYALKSSIGKTAVRETGILIGSCTRRLKNFHLKKGLLKIIDFCLPRQVRHYAINLAVPILISCYLTGSGDAPLGFSLASYQALSQCAVSLYGFQ